MSMQILLRDKKAIEKFRPKLSRTSKQLKKPAGFISLVRERHESRRIDNQLRGRSGRQGDPGASMFFLSVEDDLMRIFAGDKLEALLGNSRIGLQEGEALEHPLISKMLERAQAKVESMHFDVRKNLLKFDDVMNDQRKVVYEQRREIMEADTVEDIAADMRHEVIEDMVRATIPQAHTPSNGMLIRCIWSANVCSGLIYLFRTGRRKKALPMRK